MAYFEFLWIEETIEHIAEHGVSPDDFEYVSANLQARVIVERQDFQRFGVILRMGDTLWQCSKSWML
jgi:hypothetical protein